MANKVYKWTDDPMLGGISDCDPDVVNECLMSLKYENTSDAIQNMYTTGQVETQTRGFNQLQQMRRSTFDPLKFDVVGSPTITDDGVASGFSSSNYIKKVLETPLTQDNDLELEVNFTTGSELSEQKIVSFNGEYLTTPRLEMVSNGSIVFVCKNASGEEVYKNLGLSVANTKYVVKIINKAGTLRVLFNGTEKVRTTDFSYTISGFYIKFVSYFFKGSLDLKQFSITVDGKEVFSGNKTGIDTIKPDNYTVVGSPVISDDGVASGFSSSAYLRKVLDISITLDKTNVYGEFTTGSSYNGYGIIYHLGDFTNTNSNVLQLGVNAAGFPGFGLHNGTDWQGKYSTQKVQLNTHYLYHAYYKDGYIYLDISLDEKNWVNYIKEQINIDTSFSSNLVNISYPLKTGCWIGSIDLNAFKIYVDGNLVYQPCLKIPYTLSKTGSKIVDVAYRDRVIDLYKQQGQAGYHTIDETNKNFTLPMGEIYGMIEEKAVQIDEVRKSKVDKSELAEIYPVVKTYVNGTSGYRIWSDGYCEQWNYGLATATTGEQTFLKEFSSVPMVILTGNTTRSASAYDAELFPNTITTKNFTHTNTFVQGISWGWVARGYLAEGWNNEGIS